MSKEVDQRIVEMRFDNSDFEQKVAQSLLTFQKLKEASKLEQAGKGLEDLSKSASKVDLSPVTDSVNKLNDHFSALGVFGVSVFQRLSNAAIDMGQKVASAITAAPMDGWKEFELNTDSIKTILNSAKDDQGLPVTLDAVNEKLNELNAYSDKTIYSFSDMTSNIGKFTNAGVSLDKSVSAIQGVANVAALAGANSNQASNAMYNFAQALSSGSVRLQDWKSIENANMATVDFKKNLIQTAIDLGTLREEGDKYISTTTDMQGKVSDAFDVTTGFNDSLSAQWMTADVLVKTLGLYTDETTDLGKAAYKAATEVTTFSKLIDTLKEAMGSGWMQTWQTVVGDYNEALELWTGVNNVLSGIISKSAKARNDMLAQWKEAGGRDDLVAGLSNLWKIVANIARPISDAWHMIFPSINATGLVKLTKGFREFTEKLVPTREVMNSLRITFKGLFTLLGIGVNTIKTIAGVVLPILGKAIGAVGSVVGFLAGGFLKWVATMTSAVQEGLGLRAIIEKLLIPFKVLGEAILTARDAIVAAFGATKESIKNAQGMFGKFVDILKQIGDTVGPVVIFAIASMAEAIVDLGNKIAKVINNFKASSAGQELIKRIQTIKEAFVALPKVITAFYNQLKAGKNPLEILNSRQFKVTLLNTGFYGIISMLKQDGKKLGEALKNFFASLKDGSLFYNLAEKFGKGFEHLINKLRNVKIIGPIIDKVIEIFKKFGKFTGLASTSVTDFISKVVDKIKGIDFMKVGLVGLVGSLAIFYLRWSKVGKNASFALKALGKFIMNGGKIAQTAVDKYNGFLKIAVAIGIIAGSIYLLAQVPADRFKAVAITLGVAFAAMFAAIEILSVQKIPEDKMKAIGIAFAGLGVGFAAVAVAAKIFASMDWPALAKAGVALGVFTAMVVKAAKEAKDVGTGAGIAFVGLSAALFLLIPSILIFSKMDAQTLIKGGAAVFVFMQMIARSAKAAGDAKGRLGAFIGIAVALRILVPSIKEMAKMDAGTLIKGGVAIFAFMQMMANAAKKAGEGSTKGFFGMAIAIAVITIALKVLGTMNWMQLITSSNALSTVLDTVATALNKTAGLKFSAILKGAFGMSLAVGAIAGILYILTKYSDSTAILQSAIGISAIMFTFSKMAPAIEAFSKIPWTSAVMAATNMVTILGILVAGITALGGLNYLTDGYLAEMLANGMNMLGAGIRGFLDGLFKSSDSEGESKKATSVADNLSSFADSIKGFLDMLTTIDDSTISRAKNLAMALLAICAADILDALTGWLRGSQDLGSFGESLKPLADAILYLNDAMAGKDVDAAKIDTIINVVKKFSDLANALPKSGGWAQKLLGTQDLGEFAAGMKSFLDGGFRGFVSALNNLMGDKLGPDLIAKMIVLKNTTMAMVDIANALPKSGVIATFIDGEADLGAFAQNMKSFITDGYAEFVVAVNSVELANLATLRGNIIPAAQAMIDLSTKIDTNTGIIAAIVGKKDLGVFGEKLAEFGDGIALFAQSIAGVSVPNIQSLTAAMEQLAALNASENIKVDYLTGFGTALKNLGISLGELMSGSAGFSVESMNELAGGLSNLHNLLLILSGTDYSGIVNFTEAITTVASTSVTGFIDEFASHAEEAKIAVDGFINAAVSACEDRSRNFKDGAAKHAYAYELEFYGHWDEADAAGDGLAKAAANGAMCKDILASFKKAAEECIAKYFGPFYNRWDEADAAGDGLAKAAIGGISGLNYRFKDLGHDAADGYANGIDEYAWKAAEKARKMVQAVIDETQATQNSASPSKVFMGLAYDAVDGYALGFVKNTGMVVSAVRDTGYAGIHAMQDTIKNIQDSMGDIDARPTITPVVDLSLVMQGAQKIGSTLNALGGLSSEVSAAIDISNLNNEMSKQSAKLDYTKDLSDLIENTAKIVSAVKQNRYAIIDGDSAFDYFDRRMGMA